MSFLFGKEPVISGMCQGDKVSACLGQGGNISDQRMWELGEGVFPFTFHLVFDDPANVGRWHWWGCDEGEVHKEGCVIRGNGPFKGYRA